MEQPLASEVLTAGLRPFPILSTPPPPSFSPSSSAHPSVFPTPTLGPARQGSAKPPTALQYPRNSSPFALALASAYKTYTLKFKEVSPGFGSPRLRLDFGGPHFLCTCLQSGLVPDRRLGLRVLGESSSPGPRHHPFPPSPLCSPSGGSSHRAGRGLRGHRLPFEAETEAQAREVTWSRSHNKLEMEVAQELKLADCQLILPEKKLS